MAPKYTKISIEDLLSSPTQSDRQSSAQAGSSSTVAVFQCNASGCKRKFATEEALQAHKRRSHAPPTSFECPVCKATFSSPQNRNKHVREHNSFNAFHGFIHQFIKLLQS